MDSSKGWEVNLKFKKVIKLMLSKKKKLTEQSILMLVLLKVSCLSEMSRRLRVHSFSGFFKLF